MASQGGPVYYRPYLPSDSELSDADESSSWTSSPPPEPIETGVSPTSQNQGPDFSALAKALQTPIDLQEAAGPSLVTDVQQTAYGTNRLDRRTEFSQYQTTDASGYPLVSDTLPGTNVASIVMLQSRDRDRTVFPQPTNCQLFLPRMYKNITGFSISQLNLTSAFFYFRTNKNNLEIEIQEKGRTTYLADSTLSPTNTNAPLLLTNTIREGSYNIVDLLTELTTQLNRTPLFYDYINGFSDFIKAFSVTGDYSLNFNEPGDTYYDAVRKIYVPTPTREIICSYYFQQRYASSFNFTDSEKRCAYYYPVLKEILLDPAENSANLVLVYPGYTSDDIIQYLLYSFQGIDDPIAASVIQDNLAALDTYRLYHTFRYSLVNSYTCTYNTANNRVNINSDNLNTSLTNLLIAQYNSYLTQQLNLHGITQDYYNSLSSKIVSELAVIQEMYDYMQTQFATYFAIDYGSFSRDYYTHSNYTVQLRPGLDATGIQTAYSGSNPQPRSNDIMSDFQKPSFSYWPYMSGLGDTVGAQINMGETNNSYPTSSNHPYILAYSNMDINKSFVDSNGLIYTDYRRKAGDILVDVEAGKYTIFKFRSKVRQSLQVESLPRQTAYRYPAYNKAHPELPYPVGQLFDISYSFIDTAAIPVLKNNIINDISYNAVYGWSTMTGNGTDNIWNTSTNYSATYTNSAAFWGTQLEQINITNAAGRTYRLIAPYPVDSNTKGSNVYTYDYNVTISAYTPSVNPGGQPISTNFPSDLYAFFYHDESALAADVSAVGSRNESLYNYKEKLVLGSNVKSNTYTFKAYAGQVYYMLIRPSSTSPPATFYTVVPWTSSNYNTLTNSTAFDPTADPTTMLSNFNVAKVADPAFIRLPVPPLYTGATDNTPANDPYNKPLQVYNTPIGYDANGISTDLTDYIPFQPYSNFSTINPNATTRIDPFTNYVFNYNSNTPYSYKAQAYFYPGSSNTILTSNAASNYTAGVVTQRQYKITQIYGTTYLKDPTPLTYNSSDISPNIPPYSKTTTNGTLGGTYAYNNSNELALGSGVCGFTFLPGDGTWSIDRLTFKTNFINNLNSTNLNIHCIAIFYTSDIHPIPTSYINLKNAIGICLRVKDTTYTPNTLNIGFDSGLGTYHTFSNFSNLIVRSNYEISGYTQTARQFITDINSYYSAVGISFNTISSWDTGSVNSNNTILMSNLTYAIKNNLTTVVPIQNLVGTPIPYPFGGTPSVSNAFYDGLKPPTDDNLVVSSPVPPGNIYGPSSNLGIDESVSQYELSQPIVNSHIHYLSPLNIITDPSGFSAWDGLTTDFPDYIHASVYDTTNNGNDATSTWHTGYAIIQGPTFSMVTYKIYDKISLSTQPNRDFLYKGQISPQQIFPDGENTSIIAVTGNSSRFIFLGSSNDIVSGSNKMRMKVYNPADGFLVESKLTPDYTFDPKTETMQHFVYNDTDTWFYTVFVNNPAATPPSDPIGIKIVGMYNSNHITATYPGQTNSELQMPPDGKKLYFATYNDTTRGFSNLAMYPLFNGLPDDNTFFTSGITVQLDTTPIFDPSPAKYYKQFAVTNNRGTEEVLLTNDDYDRRLYFKIRSYLPTTSSNTSNTHIDFSKQVLKNSLSNDIGIRRIMGGAQGGKWILTDDFPYIMGNRDDVYDAPTSLSLAWQIFFPNMKIEMRKLTGGHTPITDLTNITYPEWPHTVMFAYSNYTSLSNDIMSGGGKWGLESNYMVSDVSFDGFDFNSYILNFPLHPNYSQPIGSNDDYYYLAVRGYLPTESFQTMLRFYLPNRYDFGFATFTDMINEVPLATSTPGYMEFNPVYRNTLLFFNSNFQFSNVVFGSNSISGLPGSNITSTSFSNYLDQYNSNYATFLSNSSLLSDIQNAIKKSIDNFMTSNLQYILPPDALTRQRFIDPILSRILWKDNLTPAYSVLDDEWGLGWNLGFAKSNTSYSTTHIADSFFKIQQDFIYLRLNPEFNINGMDAGGKENYKTSREPSGTTNQYYCKLLLTSFGGNATTFIHNPITFNPPINRLTRLQFQWLDSTGAIIDNNDSEWDMTVNISENIPAVPTMKDIAAFQPADPKTGLPSSLPSGFQQPTLQKEGDAATAKEAEEIAGEKQAMHDAVVKALGAGYIRTGKHNEATKAPSI